jgi:hypothetical protein
MLGAAAVVPVVDDPRSVANPNRPFERWQRAVDELMKRRSASMKALDHTAVDAFAFLDDVSVQVLGPRSVTLPDGRHALALLNDVSAGSPSAARTINGHSIVLKVCLGNVNVLLTGDLHEETEKHLVDCHDRGELSLRAEVLKVPHHGSDDVSREFIHRIEPIASVISSGDEDARRDYLHPRANLLGLLGRANRGAEPVVFVTNLAAFDRWAGRAFPAVQSGDDWIPDTSKGTFYARERTAYGIIHVRTDGVRMLVIRRGARQDRFEPYCFEVDRDGAVRPLGVDLV